MTDLGELSIQYSSIEMLELIGTGGFGEVYKAKLKPGNQMVAVKKLILVDNQDAFDPMGNQVPIIHQGKGKRS